jgi:hypothetical protein
MDGDLDQNGWGQIHGLSLSICGMGVLFGGMECRFLLHASSRSTVACSE